MINAQYLNSLWDSLEKPEETEYRLIKIAVDCIPDLNVGISRSGSRCIILAVPRWAEHNSPKREGLHVSLSRTANSRYLVVELHDPWYRDLFTEFLVSVYVRIHEFTDENNVAGEFVALFNKWSSFFQGRKSKRLSPQEIIGLFGELFYLKEKITDSTPTEINQLLSGWKGPFGGAHDFLLENKDVEVKTRLPTSKLISISNEHQLMTYDDRSLELAIITIIENDLAGATITTLVHAVRELVINSGVAIEPFWAALYEMGLDFTTITEYDDYKYLPQKLETFDCLANGFPRIHADLIPAGVCDIKYSIQLVALENFLIQHKSY